MRLAATSITLQQKWKHGMDWKYQSQFPLKNKNQGAAMSMLSSIHWLLGCARRYFVSLFTKEVAIPSLYYTNLITKLWDRIKEKGSGKVAWTFFCIKIMLQKLGCAWEFGVTPREGVWQNHWIQATVLLFKLLDFIFTGSSPDWPKCVSKTEGTPTWEFSDDAGHKPWLQSLKIIFQ